MVLSHIGLAPHQLKPNIICFFLNMSMPDRTQSQSDQTLLEVKEQSWLGQVLSRARLVLLFASNPSNQRPYKENWFVVSGNWESLAEARWLTLELPGVSERKVETIVCDNPVIHVMYESPNFGYVFLAIDWPTRIFLSRKEELQLAAITSLHQLPSMSCRPFKRYTLTSLNTFIVLFLIDLVKFTYNYSFFHRAPDWRDGLWG